jgi:hypothetical protein
MSEFLRSNPRLDKIVTDSTNFEEMRARMKAEIAGQPIVEPAPEAPAPAATVNTCHTHSRIIYPHGNDRFELTGFSDAELDDKERRIRAALGGSR